MSWDQIVGQWNQRRLVAVRHWRKVLNDELAAISGKYEKLVERLQEKYKIAEENPQQRGHAFERSIRQLIKSHNKLMEMQKALSNKRKVDSNPVMLETPAMERPRSQANSDSVTQQSQS